MEITPLGDSAALIRVADDVSESTLERVLAVHQQLESVKIRGVVEIASAYTTVAVFYDPVRVEVSSGASGVFDALAENIRQAVSVPVRVKAVKPRLINIPVCYDKDFGVDLTEVATRAGLSEEAVVERHSSAKYWVSCIGFTPGFPYLTGLPAQLATPRKANPRKEIPAGSVAIGGAQTGIYPSKSPGGWNIIGRTPLRLFDAQRNPPSLLGPGDRVQFRPISREEFNRSIE